MVESSLTRNRQKSFVVTLFILMLFSGSRVVFAAAGDLSSPMGKDKGAVRKGKHTNRLINEKSPYLLQHANNPVDWYPWGREAFDKARKENKLIFLSIGYSTCYWCHVMERNIFENEELAALMNRSFVSIKVDREERPDVDRVYMSALVAMTGSGGWPMSMFLTPDLKPFYGATYIPPDQFQKILIEVHKVWTTDPGEVRQSGQRLTDFLKRHTLAESASATLEKSILTKGYEQLRQTYDKHYAGFGRGPKFPRPATFNFLLRYYYRLNEQEALQMTLATLRKMAEGGLRDHLGGGFHRYSVDGQWRVPHFEKMLYDQAQLASSYLDAYQITHDEFYASIAREIFAYVLREMTDKDGGFYSAQDAESALDPQKPDEKEEGAFYVWTKKDIDRATGKEAAEIFEYAYGVQARGNALEDPQKVFVKKNILFMAHSVEETAKRFKKPPEVIARVLAESRARLLAERQKRPQPNLDDKVLVSWNGLMISALARAYQVLNDPSYLRAAENSSDFILTKLYDSKRKQLLRRYRAGEVRYEANLEDYAFFTMGLIDLYEAAFDTRWLRKAIELTDRQNTLFYDEKNGGFFDTSGKDDSLLLRTKEDHDGAEPAGNSIATLNLLRLSQITNNQRWRKIADRTLSLFSGRLSEIPQALPQMLAALDFHLDKPKQIIIAGNRQNEDTQRMLREVNKKYLPNRILLLADGGIGQQFLGQYLPSIQPMMMLNGKATAFICENYACKLPTTDLTVMMELLEGKIKK
jgi:uncharacterized protein YyaL (SSP411 family)